MPSRHPPSPLTPIKASSPELQIVANAISGARKIVVITGAGISTAAGIPDFRSSGGLYADGALFEEAAFFDSRRPQLLKSALRIRDLVADGEPTETHKWLASLKPKLLRCFTQNVDGLEAKAGLTTGVGGQFDCIPLHGSLANLTCHLCHELYEWQDYRVAIEGHDTSSLSLPCPRCTSRSEARRTAGRRLLPIGQLMPSMIMLDQVHPEGEEIAHIACRDELSRPDLLLVLGTSLKVEGPKRLVRQFVRPVQGHGGKMIFVNQTKPPSDFNGPIDCWVQWEVDEWVRDLKERLAPTPAVDHRTATVTPPLPANLEQPHRTMSLQNTRLPARGLSSRSPPTHVIDLTDDTVDHQPSQSQPQSRLPSPATLGHPHHTMAPPNGRSPASTALSSQEGGMASYLVSRLHPTHIIDLSDDTIQNCVNCFEVIQQGDHSRQMFAYTCGCICCGPCAGSGHLGLSCFKHFGRGLQSLREILGGTGCRVCLEDGNLVAPCGHVYCGNCVDEFTRGGSNTQVCPFCKVKVRRQEYQPLSPVRAGVCKRKKGKKVRFVLNASGQDGVAG